MRWGPVEFLLTRRWIFICQRLRLVHSPHASNCIKSIVVTLIKKRLKRHRIVFGLALKIVVCQMPIIFFDSVNSSVPFKKKTVPPTRNYLSAVLEGIGNCSQKNPLLSGFLQGSCWNESRKEGKIPIRETVSELFSSNFAMCWFSRCLIVSDEWLFQSEASNNETRLGDYSHICNLLATSEYSFCAQSGLLSGTNFLGDWRQQFFLCCPNIDSVACIR